MLKFFIITLLAIHCNCQKVVELGESVKLATGPHISMSGINSIPTLKTVGGISNTGVHPYSTTNLSPATRYLGLGLGLHSAGDYRSYGLGHQGISTYGLGLGHLAVKPAAVNYFSAIQPAVQHVAAAQPAVSTVVAQPAALVRQELQHVAVAQPAVSTVVAQSAALVRPAVQTVAVGQPALYTQALTAQQPVSAAVNQLGRSVEYKPVLYNDQPVVPQVVEVEPSDTPIHIHFKSKSSTLQLTQEHISGPPETVEHTQSQEEPSKVIHEVVKPVIQEVREVIQPYRQLSQEINPVVESVHTVIAKREGKRQQFVQPVVRFQTVAQPVAQIQTVAQPVAQIQTVAQPVAQIQTVAQPIVQTVAQPVVQTVAQPFGLVKTYGSIAQPGVSTIGAVAQPLGLVKTYGSIAQPGVSTIGAVAQPMVEVAEVHKSIVQPSVSSVHSQPFTTVLGSETLLNSGILKHDIAKHVGLGGVSSISARTHPIGTISRTYH